MSGQTFDGIDHAEEIFFISRYDLKETCDKIREKMENLCSYGFIDASIGELRAEFTRRRLLFCEDNIHCDITYNENRYRLRLFYTIESTSWVYWLLGILYIVFIGRPILNSRGDETTNTLIFFGLLALVLWIVYRLVQANPEQELHDSCMHIKKELEAYIKLELE